jgi:hypothetical protein
VDWIQQGCQRRAVVQALYKPLSGREILEIARTWAPEIQLRDVWFVLQQLGEKALARCLTPELATGNLYCLTARGSALKASAFGTPTPALPVGIDWIRYAFVVRARVRRMVVGEIGSPAGAARKANPPARFGNAWLNGSIPWQCRRCYARSPTCEGWNSRVRSPAPMMIAPHSMCSRRRAGALTRNYSAERVRARQSANIHRWDPWCARLQLYFITQSRLLLWSSVEEG